VKLIENLVKKIVFKSKADSKTYIKYLRSIGMSIGNDVIIYVPHRTVIDEQYPWMISIGDHVRITEGVKILTHDYSWSVLKLLDFNKQSGLILGASGKVIIGNNVFIGMNAIILRNVTIGDNVVIGAGSIVTKDCDSGFVYAGNPTKKIMTIQDFYVNRFHCQLQEAKELAISYKKRFGKDPGMDVFHEYFMLFTNSNNDSIFKDKMKLCGNYDDSLRYIHNNKSMFSSYENFLSYCFSSQDEEVKYDEF